MSSLASEHRTEARCVTLAVAGLASTLLAVPLEIRHLGVEPSGSPASAIAALLVSPSASALALSRVPPRVHSDRPLEIELTGVGYDTGSGAATSVARWISDHARLAIAVEVAGQSRVFHSLPVSARPSGGGWIARALIRPASWADAAFVTVVSLSLAGQPLPCECLPATLRVGYNHAPAPAGAVLRLLALATYRRCRPL